MPSNSKGESESKSNTDIQSEYIVNLTKMKILEAKVIVYGVVAPLIVP